MLFPSFSFMLGFLPLTALVYFILAPRSRNLSRIWLIAASFVFYSWFHYSYSLILAGSILGNYLIAEALHRRRSRMILLAGLIFNIGLLGYFKYYDFFIANLNEIFRCSLTFKHILLPLGISFFTFQQISFLCSVYSRSLEQKYDFPTYALFVSFFPQLIAGPIVLPDEMMPQFNRPENLRPRAENISKGLFIFSLGLAKKILLADFFAAIADAGFESASVPGFFTAWKSALAYTGQIYFDFSGYCDMAMGIGLIFNIRLPLNFDAPYRSASIAEFWRRWHITLGRFLMTFLYFPLGGSRCSRFRTCVNLMITFLISGLWHGASWLFVLWGGLHGLALVIHRIWSRFTGHVMPRIPAQVLTFFFVTVTWVVFRAADMGQMKRIFTGMFLPSEWDLHVLLNPEDAVLFSAAAVILFCWRRSAASYADDFRPTWFNGVLAAALMIASMLFFVKTSPFIYFNF